MSLFKHVNPDCASDDSCKQGNVGLSRAIYEFTRLGYNVLIPLTDINQYDLVIEKDHKFKMIQCKTTTRRDTKTREKPYAFNLVKKKKYKTKTYDFLFVLTADDACYIIPRIELPPTVIKLTKRFDMYKIENLIDPVPDMSYKAIPDPNTNPLRHLLNSMAIEQQLTEEQMLNPVVSKII